MNQISMTTWSRPCTTMKAFVLGLLAISLILANYHHGIMQLVMGDTIPELSILPTLILILGFLASINIPSSCHLLLVLPTSNHSRTWFNQHLLCICAGLYMLWLWLIITLKVSNKYHSFWGFSQEKRIQGRKSKILALQPVLKHGKIHADSQWVLNYLLLLLGRGSCNDSRPFLPLVTQGQVRYHRS